VKDYYLVRDLDTLPGVSHASELFNGTKGAPGMSGRHRLPFTALAAALGAVLLLVFHPPPSLGQVDRDQREKCTLIADTDIRASAARTTPSLTSFPVVVHYMKHQSEGSGPGSAARTAFPLNEVKAFFEEGGEFNRVWWKKHQKVMFVLVGVETCPYKLGEGVIPAASASLMKQIGAAYNVRKWALASGPQPFTGLDLYLWAGIQVSGQGDQVGGFALSAAALKRSSVWLAPDCRHVQNRNCDSKFGHEAGHFFGLCHVCAVLEGEMNPDTCRQTCPIEAQAGKRLDTCATRDEPRLMADQGGIDLDPCELSFAVNNASSILASAGH
jgi:hypothetical protein